MGSLRMGLRYAATLGAVVCAMAAAGCGTSDGSQGERVGSSEQALSSGYYFSWGGTMNSAGTAYTNGAAWTVEIGLNLSQNVICELAGITGNLTFQPDIGVDGDALVSILPDSSGNWWLSARGAPNSTVSAAAVCFSVPNASKWESVWGGYPYDDAQYFSGILSVAGVSGSPAQITVSDEGSNPNVSPLHYGTWTMTTNANVNPALVVPGGWPVAQVYSSYWVWSGTGTTFTETMPAGTSCFLTSIDGNLQENSFSNGAWTSVNYKTGAWTFTAAANTTAWWLCLN
jgi:hypothetical protein